MANDLSNLSISAHVKNPEYVLFDAENIESISSTNRKGPFDILPAHENFISIIKDDLIIRLKDGGKRAYKVDIGILKVTNNKVKIFLGVETNKNPQNTNPEDKK